MSALCSRRSQALSLSLQPQRSTRRPLPLSRKPGKNRKRLSRESPDPYGWDLARGRPHYERLLLVEVARLTKIDLMFLIIVWFGPFSELEAEKLRHHPVQPRSLARQYRRGQGHDHVGKRALRPLFWVQSCRLQQHR